MTGATLTEMFKEIDKLRAEGSGGAELQGAKKYLRGIFVDPERDAERAVGTLNTMYIFGLPKDYPETFQRKIAALSRRSGEDRRAQMLLGSENR